MKYTLSGLGGIVLVAALAGCAAESEAEPQVYHCGAYTVEVSAQPGDQLQLHAGEAVYDLEPVESASGAAYTTGEDDNRVTTFWSHGDTAILELNSQSMPVCARPGAIIEPFTARGNEPFWQLQVEEGQARLRRPGEDDVEVAATVTRSDQMSRVQSPDKQLTATIRDQVCSDSMSGMQYPKSVQLSYQDTRYEGCGGAPERLLQGVTWNVQMLGDESVKEQELTLHFTAEGSISGFAGCNRFFGRYDMTGEGIELTRLGSTKRACADEQMELEAGYLELLTSTRRFRVNELDDDSAATTRLTLRSAEAELTATY